MFPQVTSWHIARPDVNTPVTRFKRQASIGTRFMIFVNRPPKKEDGRHADNGATKRGQTRIHGIHDILRSASSSTKSVVWICAVNCPRISSAKTPLAMPTGSGQPGSQRSESDLICTSVSRLIQSSMPSTICLFTTGWHN